MSIDVDGFSIATMIGANSGLFQGVAGDVTKAMKAVVVKSMKHKQTGLAELQKLRSALGGQAFNLVTDGIADKDIPALVVKFDKHNQDVKQSPCAALRLHLAALADGSAKPKEKSKAATKPPKAKKPVPAPEVSERLSYSSAGRIRNR